VTSETGVQGKQVGEKAVPTRGRESYGKERKRVGATVDCVGGLRDI